VIFLIASIAKVNDRAGYPLNIESTVGIRGEPWTRRLRTSLARYVIFLIVMDPLKR
jgi:hypothetical protein